MAKIEPKGKQIDVLGLKVSGHSVVLGTAGSGKTTIAVLRARYLANAFPKQRVLFVTFNKALLAYLDDAYDILPRNVDARNYHRFARGYLNSIGQMGWKCILDDSEIKYKLVEQCIEDAKNRFGDNSTLNRPVEVFTDEIQYLQHFGIDTLEDYLTIERIGRASTYIKRENRQYFFYVFERYQELREECGYNYDWDDLAYHTYKALIEDTRPRLYTHIVVDEGQDFSPMMLKSLIAAIPTDGSFIFFGDVAQQIYGSRISWRDAGISISNNEIWRFKDNYRNSHEIVSFASDIVGSIYWKSSEDLVPPSATKAYGPKPQLIHFKDATTESEWVIAAAIRLADNSSNVIIVRDHTLVDKFILMFRRRGVRAQKIEGKMQAFSSANGVSVTTFYSAKGLEFDNVFIPFLCNNNFPDPEKLQTTAEEDVCADEIKLLYVAVTRARRGLYMSYHDELTKLFPLESVNYDSTEM